MQPSGASQENIVQRWVDWAAIWLGLGIAIYYLWPHEPSLWASLGLIPPILVGWRVRANLGRLQLTLAMLSVWLGFICATAQTARLGNAVLSVPLDGVRIEGRIREMVPQGNRLRLTLDQLAIDGVTPERTPPAARLAVAAGNNALTVGERVSMRGRLAPPARPVMPGAFDFGRYFYFQGIGAIGYAMPPVTRVAAPPHPSVSERTGVWMARLRLALKEYFLAMMPGESGKIAAALVTGDQSLVSAKVSADMRVAGLTHILAISGMHMTIVCGLVFEMVRLLLAAIPYTAHRWNGKKIAAAIALVTGSFYLWLAEFPISAVRAHIMIVLYLGAILLGREADALRSLTLAAIFLFLFLPSSLLDPGFQLSFAAVLALILFFRYWHARRIEEEWQKKPLWWRIVSYPFEIALTTLVATLATAPISAYHFHTFVPYGLFANMLAIPLASFVITPLMVLALPAHWVGLDGPVLRAGGWAIDGMIWIAREAAAMPYSVFRIPPIPLFGLSLLVMGGLLMLLRGRPCKLAAVALVLAGIASGWSYRPPDLLIAEDGKAIALHENGDWKLLRGSPTQFAVHEWQTATGGDYVVPEKGDIPARCDGQGCVYRIDGLRVALPRYPHAAVDDCALADLVVLPEASHPLECRAVLIDANALRDHGAHGVSFREGKLEVTTGCGESGRRPWSRCAIPAK